MNCPIAHAEIDKTFQPYYNEYMFFIQSSCLPKDYRYPIRITIHFGKIKKNDNGYDIVGETTYYDSMKIFHNADIIIDKEHWDEASKTERFALIFHELTHAFFIYPDLKSPIYKYHFMYWTSNYVTIWNTKVQLMDILESRCSRHRQSETIQSIQ